MSKATAAKPKSLVEAVKGLKKYANPGLARIAKENPPEVPAPPPLPAAKVRKTK